MVKWYIYLVKRDFFVFVFLKIIVCKFFGGYKIVVLVCWIFIFKELLVFINVLKLIEVDLFIWICFFLLIVGIE